MIRPVVADIYGIDARPQNATVAIKLMAKEYNIENSRIHEQNCLNIQLKNRSMIKKRLKRNPVNDAEKRCRLTRLDEFFILKRTVKTYSDFRCNL